MSFTCYNPECRTNTQQVHDSFCKSCKNQIYLRDLQPRDYVLATKYSDGDPGDHWVIGFFQDLLQKGDVVRANIVDSDGNLFRGNGFRRVKKISIERGLWLLKHKEVIAGSDHSLWWWVRQNMDSLG